MQVTLTLTLIKSLNYNSISIKSFELNPSFSIIFKAFGPSFPGTFDLKTMIYSLSYPGISFLFPLTDDFLPLNLDELPFLSHDGLTAPVLSGVQIFDGPSFELAAPRDLVMINHNLGPI